MNYTQTISMKIHVKINRIILMLKKVVKCFFLHALHLLKISFALISHMAQQFF
jgi:hypothetical protein